MLNRDLHRFRWRKKGACPNAVNAKAFTAKAINLFTIIPSANNTCWDKFFLTCKMVRGGLIYSDFLAIPYRLRYIQSSDEDYFFALCNRTHYWLHFISPME